MSLSVSLLTAVVAPVVFALSASSARAELPQFDVTARYRIPIATAPSRGPTDARITIVEFSDFACQFCRRARVTVDLLERLYPDDIRLVFRVNPLDPEDGTLASEASMAAREQGRFWPMHDRIFAAGGAVSRAQLESFALELGLDVARFREALDSRRYRPHVDQVVAENARLGVRSTPMFFINGRPIKGSQPLSVFVGLVEEELATARTLTAAGVPAAGLYERHMADARERADGPRSSGKNQLTELDDTRTYRADYTPPGHALGPADALVEVVVFTDFQCQFCRQLVPALRAIRASYPDDVRIVFRHQPLDFHRDAELAAEASVAAAAQGRFWAMHDRIFEHFERMKRADLDEHGRAIGLDMARFRADLDAGRYRDMVLNDLAIGGALGVRGTPTLLINGTPIRGVRPYETLVASYIEPKLEEARAMVETGVARRDVVASIVRQAERYPAGESANESGAGAPSGSAASGQGDAGTRMRDLYITCSARDGNRARHWFQTLRSHDRRARARTYCRAFGIEFND